MLGLGIGSNLISAVAKLCGIRPDIKMRKTLQTNLIIPWEGKVC